MAQHGSAGQDLVGAGAQQGIVAGDIGFAFGAIDDQDIDRIAGRRQLQIGGKDTAAEADDAGVAQARGQGRRLTLPPVRPGLQKMPVLVPIRCQLDAGQGTTGRMADVAITDRNHLARGRRMDMGRKQSDRLADALSLVHLVAGSYARACRLAQMLQQRHVKLRRQGHGAQAVVTGDFSWLEPQATGKAMHCSPPPAASRRRCRCTGARSA